MEDVLRARDATHAEALRQVEARVAAAEAGAVRAEKVRAKLERDLEKLQKRHAELRQVRP